MTATDQITDVQERVLDGFESAQARILEMNTNLADAVNGVIDTEGFRVRRLPGMGELPPASELIDRYYDFATRLAEINRAFYKEMVRTWTVAEVKPAAKAGNRKSTARKSTTKKASGKKVTARKADNEDTLEG